MPAPEECDQQQVQQPLQAPPIICPITHGTQASDVWFFNPNNVSEQFPDTSSVLASVWVGKQSHNVWESDVEDEDMLDVDVALQKENYGEPGSSDSCKSMVMDLLLSLKSLV